MLGTAREKKRKSAETNFGVIKNVGKAGRARTLEPARPTESAMPNRRGNTARELENLLAGPPQGERGKSSTILQGLRLT